MRPGDTARWRRILAVAAGRPIRELWAAGRLTCSDCGRPLDELRVQARGGNLFMGFDVVADWRAGVDARGGCG